MDRYVTENVCMVADVQALPFKDGAFSEVAALDLVEHVSWRKTRNVLRELARVLSPDGEAEIRVPDIDALIELRNGPRMNDREFLRRIFGDQGHPGDFHHAGFTGEILEEELVKVGLKVVERWVKNGNTTTRCRPAASP